MKNKNDSFAKDKILQASKIDEVEFEIFDMTERNKLIVEQFEQTLSKPSQKKQKPRMKAISYMAASFFVVVALALVLPFVLNNNEDFVTNEDLYATSVTWEEIIQQVDNIRLPNLTDYSISSALLFKHKESQEKYYVEILLLNQKEETIVLTVTFIDTFKFPDYNDYSDLGLSDTVNNILYTYNINASDKIAFARFSLQPYEYYLYFRSEEPENISLIIETFI